MDCEKAEPLLLDELYDELDEVTSAAVKRHVSGCAKCGGILTGMRNTRRLAALPLVPLPAGLEDRILTSIKEAQRVVPIQSRMARVLSLAGSWAMRPQTAMAAVFLLMIGTSAFVIRSRRAADPQAVSVTEQGSPAATAAPAAEQDSLDSKAAAAAHGPNAPVVITHPPTTATAAPAASAANGQGFAFNDPNSAGPVDGLTAGKGRVGKRDEEAQGALASALAESESSRDKDSADSEAKREARKNAPVGNVTTTPATPAPMARAATGSSNRRGDISNAGGSAAGAPYGGDDYAPRAQTVAPPAKEKAAESGDAFSSGMAAYRARKFADATKEFDAAAKNGDQNAALWAAKSVKEGNGGCNSAIPRFDSIAQKGGDSWHGHEAQLEAARCQIALGRLDEARTRLAKLQTVASHSQQAQQALNDLNQVAQKREADRAKQGGAGAGGAAGAARAAPAPARAPAAPRATAADQAGF